MIWKNDFHNKYHNFALKSSTCSIVSMHSSKLSLKHKSITDMYSSSGYFPFNKRRNDGLKFITLDPIPYILMTSFWQVRMVILFSSILPSPIEVNFLTILVSACWGVRTDKLKLC